MAKKKNKGDDKPKFWWQNYTIDDDERGMDSMESDGWGGSEYSGVGFGGGYGGYTKERGRQAASSSWRSKLGSWGNDTGFFTSVGSSEKRERLERIQRQLCRTVNVVCNAHKKDDTERTLSIGFSDGTKANKPDNSVVYLSPDDILNETAQSLGEANMVDALTGQVLVASAMKKTMSRRAFRHAEQHKEAKAKLVESATELWQSIETAEARGEVLKDWGGFEPYIQAHAAAKCLNKSEIQERLEVEKPSLELVTHALSWNMQFPNDPIILPPTWKEEQIKAAEAAVNEMATRPEPHNRFKSANQIVTDLSKVFEVKSSGNSGGGEGPSQPPPEGGKGEPGDGKGKPKGGKGGTPPPPEPKPEEEEKKPEPSKEKGTTDKSLFGETVVNTTADAADVPQAKEADGKADEVIMLPVGVREPNQTAVIPMEQGSVSEYTSLVSKLRPSINQIAAALRFRNNDISTFIRGVSSGDLDDGSLEKLCMHESSPAIWERREVHGQPKIAVGLLLDQSGSMGGTRKNAEGQYLSKIVYAREVCIAVLEAMKMVKGIDTMVIGHTADRNAYHANHHTKVYAGSNVRAMPVKTGMSCASEYCELVLYEYATVQQVKHFGLAEASAMSDNADGFAMEYCIRKMMQDYPNHPRRLLFVISDGQPAAHCGGGDEAMTHMRRVVEFGEQHKVHTYGVGICNAYDNARGEKMYGKGKFCVLHDVVSSIPILTSFLRQVAMAR